MEKNKIKSNKKVVRYGIMLVLLIIIRTIVIPMVEIVKSAKEMISINNVMLARVYTNMFVYFVILLAVATIFVLITIIMMIRSK